ncbi:MAG: SWI/SNF-related matrix-associated actin-dependent regulator of chromatin subfamily A-like protein 1, partial [Marteilia pararefringens]
EFQKWCDDLTDLIKVVNSKNDEIEGFRIIIATFDLITNIKSSLTKIKSNCTIVDESHYLKELKSKRCKTISSVLQRCKRVILLSGTPALSRPRELFSQLRIMRPDIFGKYHDYCMRYCSGIKSPYGWDFSGSSNENELRIIMESLVMIRRLKANILDNMPKKTRQCVILSESSDLRSFFDNNRAIYDQRSTMSLNGFILSLFSATSLWKIPLVL